MASVDELKSLASSKLGFARTSNFLVELPSTFGANSLLGRIATLGGNELNILCSSATLPGKQILTHDRRIGMEFQKMAYGYAVDDVSMTFYLMNDYGVKKYFDNWRSSVINETGMESNYKKEYARTVQIHQLRQPLKGFSKQLGPIRFNLGLGGGSVYSVDLIDAFPINTSQVDLNNELDGLVQLTVTFAYTNWRVASGVQNFINMDIQTPLGGISLF